MFYLIKKKDYKLVFLIHGMSVKNMLLDSVIQNTKNLKIKMML